MMATNERFTNKERFIEQPTPTEQEPAEIPQSQERNGTTSSSLDHQPGLFSPTEATDSGKLIRGDPPHRISF